MKTVMSVCAYMYVYDMNAAYVDVSSDVHQAGN